MTELCFVLDEDDNQWYRAHCIEVAGDGNPGVLYVDHGNIAAVSTANIRKMPEKFAYRLVTFDCKINGMFECGLKFLVILVVIKFYIVGLTEEQLKQAVVLERLTELLAPGRKICATSVECLEEEGLIVLTLPHILDTLKTEKII